MKSEIPKVLQKLAGRSIIDYTLENLRKVRFGKIVVVVGHKKNEVIRHMQGNVEFVEQVKVLGTGDAAFMGVKSIADDIGSVLIVNGDDSAFYSIETLNGVYEKHINSRNTITFVTVKKENPYGLGRIIRNNQNRIIEIVEEKDASDKQKMITEVNAGLYVFDTSWLKKYGGKIRKSSSGEYYIVDLIASVISQGKRVEGYKLEDSDEWVGVNTGEQLEFADRKMKEKISGLLNS